MTGISTRVVEFDDAGEALLHVAPGFYLGASGASGATNQGDDLGTAFLTSGTAQFVVGDVNVTGTPATEAALYFQFGG